MRRELDRCFVDIALGYDQAEEFEHAVLWDLDGNEVPAVDVTVVAVTPAGQAAALGVQVGDIITGYDG